MDLADVLEEFGDRAGTPGQGGGVWVSIGAPHAAERRTVQLTAEVADWLTEVVRSELEDLRAVEGDDRRTVDQRDGDRGYLDRGGPGPSDLDQGGGGQDEGPGPAPQQAETWWG